MPVISRAMAARRPCVISMWSSLEMSADYTTEELMISAIADELADDELGFVGLGTAARAFTLAVGIPIAASRLAQLKHAPGFSIYWGNLLTPDLQSIPDNLLQDQLTRWPGAASPADVGYKVDMITRGCFDVSFDSAPQIDQFGNMNITAIGDGIPPKVRLVGCLAQTEHFAFVKRPIIVTDLKRRAFVHKVDYITSVGYLDGGESRAALGLSGPGPALVFTDRAVFDFHPTSKRMRLRSVHPGETVRSVLNQMDFEPVIEGEPPQTKAPTMEDIRLIRTVIDPTGTLFKAGAK
jgi:glutaconate CoA-transferase subunit B